NRTAIRTHHSVIDIKAGDLVEDVLSRPHEQVPGRAAALGAPDHTAVSHGVTYGPARTGDAVKCRIAQQQTTRPAAAAVVCHVNRTLPMAGADDDTVGGRLAAHVLQAGARLAGDEWRPVCP